MNDGPDTPQVESSGTETAGAEMGQADLPNMGPPDPAKELRDRAIAAISNVYDPEIPVNIYELGLVYEINISPDRNIEVCMTLTSPHCPVAEWLPMEVQRQVLSIEGVNDVRVELVWDPPWSPEMMTEAAKLELGFF